ncbi:MAG: hypothetical protein DRI77_13220 [Chloroflexi bacterium]|nr:MAG: hypothetical protein DRI77_13220 [Chloroflexota bacterium]
MVSNILEVRKSEPILVGNRIKTYDSRNDLQKTLSLTRQLKNEFRDIHDWANGNRVRLIDSMDYDSSALAKAAWVPADDAATNGITVEIDETNYLNGDASVKLTTGSAFASAVKVTKSLTGDASTFPEDKDAIQIKYQNWTPYNYIIVPRHAAQALAATDIDLIITDWQDRDATYSLPAIDSNHADLWGTYAVAFSSFTEDTGFDWRAIKSISFELNGGTMGNGEVISIAAIRVCKYCSGHAPAAGVLVPVELGADSVVEGMQLKLTSVDTIPVVGIGGDGDEEIIGIACGSGDTGDVILMQIAGPALVELGSLTSLEVGDYLAGAAQGGLTWTEAAGTGADACAKYIAPFVDNAAQYTLAWIMFGVGGAVPS